MADEVRLDITSVAHNKGLTDAARDMRGLRSEAERLTGTLGTLEDGSFSLDQAIEETNEEVARLRKEFAETGDTTLFGDLRRQQSTLSNLQKIKEAIEDVTEATAEMGGAAAQAGGGGAQFGSSFGGRMGPAIITGVITGLLPHLPMLGAIVAGAVAGTVGTGGVIGGIAMASNSPEVKSGAKALASSISAEFFRESDQFAGPTLAAMAEIDDAFKDMKVPEAFLKAAPTITTIAEGFGNMGRNIMPGLNKALERMGPFADVAANGFGDLGTALGGLMRDATDSQGTLQGLNHLFKLLAGAITLTGGALEVSSDIFGAFSMAGERVFGTLEKLGIGGPIPGVAESLRDVNAKTLRTDDAFASLHERLTEPSWDEYRAKIEGVNKAMSDAFDVTMSVDQANLAVAAGLAAVNETFKENKGHWDTSTEQGRENNEVLLAQIQNLNGQREANIAAGQDAKTANANFDTQLQTLLRLAAAAGATKEQLDALARGYVINVKVNVTGLANVDKIDNRRGFAAGSPVLGPTPAGEPFLVGEKEPEWMFSNRQHFVATAAQVQAQAASGGGMMAQPFVYGGANAMEAYVIDQIRAAVRAAGGTLAVIGIRN